MLEEFTAKAVIIYRIVLCTHRNVNTVVDDIISKLPFQPAAEVLVIKQPIKPEDINVARDKGYLLEDNNLYLNQLTLTVDLQDVSLDTVKEEIESTPYCVFQIIQEKLGNRVYF